MTRLVQFHEQAEFLRESSGSHIEKTLLKAVKVLALFDIPHYVRGGFAVQEHGYARFTVDVDLIVPDVQVARDKLCMNGFKENPGSQSAREFNLLPFEPQLEWNPTREQGVVKRRINIVASTPEQHDTERSSST